MGSSYINKIEPFGWYALGNGKTLNELISRVTNKANPAVAYFGDSLKSDIIYPKRLYRLVILIMITYKIKQY